MLSNKIFYLKDNELKLDDELKALINSNTNIVIKIGEKDEIIYEWNIIKNLRKYIPKGIPKYISSPKKYNNFTIKDYMRGCHLRSGMGMINMFVSLYVFEIMKKV